MRFFILDAINVVDDIVSGALPLLRRALAGESTTQCAERLASPQCLFLLHRGGPPSSRAPCLPPC